MQKCVSGLASASSLNITAPTLNPTESSKTLPIEAQPPETLALRSLRTLSLSPGATKLRALGFCWAAAGVLWDFSVREFYTLRALG